MKCKVFEERIYLYEELSESEKVKIDEHRSHCQACNKLADRTTHSLALIRKASLFKAEVKNPHQLTQQIMNSIAKEKGASVLHQLSFYLDSLIVRYAFGVASLLLVTFFLYELPTIDGVDSNNQATRTEIKSGPVLDMKLFLNTYRNQRTNKDPARISKYAYYKSIRSVKPYNP